MTLAQHPSPGASCIYRCGDVFQLTLTVPQKALRPFLRTSLGGAKEQHAARILKTEENLTTSRNNWMDLPLNEVSECKYEITLPLFEVGYFAAKVWLEHDETQEVTWVGGDNIHIKVEPASTLFNNSIYGIFTRQFGVNKHKAFAGEEEIESIKRLDEKGYHVIPPAGKFRDLIGELDHIMDKMGFRILQLLPIHPTPTTFARMGRFGSPYAALDFFDVNPALAEFDTQATPLDQFEELVDEVHRRNGEIFLDIPVDHTGWASTLQKDHPEYFVRDHDGHFVSPGAWGTTWEDLIKLDFSNIKVHQMMAKVFLFWCKKGVNGFRCDAGYMLPFEAWEYIIAKVREEFPYTIFLLEGLGGPPETTELLLSRATFSWAYSELFQNYTKEDITRYISQMLRINAQKGGLVNFSETHDNNRLAATSHTWSKMRNLLCALTAPAGAFGISNGVEFFAEEKISVHHANGLNWGSSKNQIDLIKRLTTLFKIHPAFYADATIKIVAQNAPEIFMCQRTAGNGDSLLIIINLNCEESQLVNWDSYFKSNKTFTDLITDTTISPGHELAPGSALCIDNTGLYCERLRSFDKKTEKRIQNLQLAKETLLKIHAHINGFSSLTKNYIAKHLESLLYSPLEFCLNEGANLAQIVLWDAASDAQRLVMAGGKSVLLIHHKCDFNYTLASKTKNWQSGKAIQSSDSRFFALVPLKKNKKTRTQYLNLKVNVKEKDKTHSIEGNIALLNSVNNGTFKQAFSTQDTQMRELYALCTNKVGSISQISGLWGAYKSKYDGFFTVNLDEKVPVDRTVLISRFRCWVLVNNFSHELSEKSQYLFAADGSKNVRWSFKAPTGQGKYVLLDIHWGWDEEQNRATLSFIRHANEAHDNLLNAAVPITIIVRPDIDYRSNHETTKAFMGAESLFPQSITCAKDGFIFAPYASPALHLKGIDSTFTSEPEWHYMQHLPEEEERGLEYSTDLFSPGYFSLELTENQSTHINASVGKVKPETLTPPAIPAKIAHEEAIKRSMRQFIVRRDEAQTVIAGYPWFLDWGRDTLICLRGIIAADMQQEAQNIILTFAKYEENGTLPNMIRGNNADNRDTSDAPLWFVVAVKDYVTHFHDHSILEMNCAGRSVKKVIKSIVSNYEKGTPNGIRMDKESALIYSPSHFTWMDTNYPAGTPREGYPIEIQALWQAAVNYLSTVDEVSKWQTLSEKIKSSIMRYYPLENNQGFSDCLHTKGFQSAHKAKKDDACRPNQLFAITLNAVSDRHQVKNILIATQSLIMPGAIRSLKDAKISVSLPILKGEELLNDPKAPYWGHYCGDEDTRRKPAYHNGTGWAWPFFSYCEALFQYVKDKEAVYPILMSAQGEMEKGILNHLPEVCDGNVPHRQKGCRAQAWSITEFYRILKIIN